MTTPTQIAAALTAITSRVRTSDTVVKTAEGPKRTGVPLTTDRLLKHLGSGPVRGCYIMEPGTTTRAAVLDLDNHRGASTWAQMTTAARRLMESHEILGGGGCMAFRSGGGAGVHLWFLWDKPQDAYSVRQWLMLILRSCGYKSGTGGVAAGEVEIYPKSDEVKPGRWGTQVWLPLAGLSVPLAWEDLAGELVPGSRDDVVGSGWVWPVADPVPVVERPAPRVLAAGGSGAETAAELAEIREMLGSVAAAVISGKRLMGHDPWRTLVQALHKTSGGSEDGRALAHWFSEQIPDYGPDRLDQIWDTSDAAREGGVGLGSLKRLAGECGWTERLDDGDFVAVPDDRPPSDAVFQVENKSKPGGLGSGAAHGGTAGGVGSGSEMGSGSVQDAPAPAPRPSTTTARPRVKRKGIPEAHFLTTDLANAQRLKNAFGSQVFVSAGRWHVWDGKRWAADEADVYRYGARLSDLIREEAKPFRARAAEAEGKGDTAEAKKQGLIADALEKWAKTSEMKATIEACVGLVKKMLTLDPEALDADPWALNCENGVVDLRTGEIRRHDPADYITKLVPLRYMPGAKCARWEQVLREIVGGSDPVARYLQRWFGYCLTGDTREQCFVVHWGGGSNGKSTVLDIMGVTLGDYATTAAPGLMMASKGDRHPTEIAALFGRRQVTAHESGEGVVLREDFIKQATGGDRITARRMREDFFEFAPTHKLQLLTNHKPSVKGQDAGIWRRVMLVPYTVSFGSAAEVASGERDAVKDTGLLATLREELEGILAWRVRGAVEWAQDGLQPPDVVLAASAGYKSEQDRVGQFVGECCEVGSTLFEEPLTEGMAGGLYPAYVSWCKDGGIFPMSKLRFLDDVLRVVPAGRVEDRLMAIGDGKRRKVKMVRGVRLLAD